MRNLNWKRFGLALLAAFLGSVGFLVFVAGYEVDSAWTALMVAYKAFPIVAGVATLFGLYAWRWPIFQKWLVPFPDLNGTWQGSLQTTWQNPGTGEIPGPIPVTLRIKQTFLQISCVMQTREMTSRSFIAGFWIDPDQQIRKLSYSYHSSPLFTVQHRSAPHDGTIVLDIIDDPPKELAGPYWSSRKTTGHVSVSFISRDLIEGAPMAAHPVTNAD